MAQKTSRRKVEPNDKQKSARPPEQNRSGVPKPSALTIGDELEYRIARLHIFSGFFVRRGCPIYTIAALDRATDLDVLAFRYSEPFRREMIITECKSGNTAPLDRIFWLTGVRDYMQATQAFLIRKGTKWNIKDFAKECGVQVLDLARVTEIEATLKIGEDEWPGVCERAFFEANLATWNRALASEPRFWELYQTLSSEIRFDDAFVGINYLLSQLRLLTRQWGKPPDEPYFRFLLSESITQMAVFLIRIAEQSFDLSSEDRHGFIRKGLTYGNLEPQYADRILNSAYNMTRQAVQHYTHQFVDIDKSLFLMPVPPGTDGIIGFVDDLLSAYPASLSFPQICDLILFEVFTKRKEARGWLKRIFPQSNLAVRVDVIRRFIAMLVSIGACPAYVQDIVFVVGRSAATADAKQMPAVDPGQNSATLPADAGAGSNTERIQPPASDAHKPATALPEKTEQGGATTKREPHQEDLGLAENAKGPTSKTDGPDRQN
jgi:hypothetical protein